MNPRCSETVYGNVFRGHQCTREGKVERDGRWFCSQHDPERARARGAAKAAERQARQAQDDEVEREAHRLAEALGVYPQVYRVWSWPRKETLTVPSIVISFEDVKKLIERLKEK